MEPVSLSEEYITSSYRATWTPVPSTARAFTDCSPKDCNTTDLNEHKNPIDNAENGSDRSTALEKGRQ